MPGNTEGVESSEGVLPDGGHIKRSWAYIEDDYVRKGSQGQPDELSGGFQCHKPDGGPNFASIHIAMGGIRRGLAKAVNSNNHHFTFNYRSIWAGWV